MRSPVCASERASRMPEGMSRASRAALKCGERRASTPVHRKVTGPDGQWGPFVARAEDAGDEQRASRDGPRIQRVREHARGILVVRHIQHPFHRTWNHLEPPWHLHAGQCRGDQVAIECNRRIEREQRCDRTGGVGELHVALQRRRRQVVETTAVDLKVPATAAHREVIVALCLLHAGADAPRLILDAVDQARIGQHGRPARTEHAGLLATDLRPRPTSRTA